MKLKSILNEEILYFKTYREDFGKSIQFTKAEKDVIKSAGGKLSSLDTEQHPGIMYWKWYSDNGVIRNEFQIAKYEHVYAWALLYHKVRKVLKNSGNKVFDGIEDFRELKKVIAIAKKYINTNSSKEDIDETQKSN